MEKYCKQLIGDIRQAKAQVPQPWWTFVDQDELPVVWTEDPNMVPRKSLEEWTGIKKVQIPPGNFLSERQIHILLQELKEMLGAYNCHVVFQIVVPERLQYEVIRKRFDQESPLLMTQMHFFEFCDPLEEKKNCLLGPYCHCHFIDELIGDNEEDGIDFETGHSFSTDEWEAQTGDLDFDISFYEDFHENEYDDFDSWEWDDEDEEEDWNI